MTRDEFIASTGETGARMLEQGFQVVECDPESCGYVDCKGWRMKFNLEGVPRDEVLARLRAAVGVDPSRLRGRTRAEVKADFDEKDRKACRQ